MPIIDSQVHAYWTHAIAVVNHEQAVEPFVNGTCAKAYGGSPRRN